MQVLKFLLMVGILFPVSASAEKVLRYSEDGAPTNLDPAQASTVYANAVVTATYDTLFEYKYLKRPFELKANLATGMPEVSKDGLTYTFKIKKGVRYADDGCFAGGKGREVIAEDLVYSIKRHFDPKMRSQGAWLWQNKIVGLDAWKKAGSDYKKQVPGLLAKDKYTIQIKLTKPFPQLTYTFAMGFSAFVPHEAVKKYGQELSIHPVGSGPFRLISHNSRKTVLVRNSKYRKDTFDLKREGYVERTHGGSGLKSLQGKSLPIVDRVEMNWMKEPVARWNSFTKGNEVVWTVLLLEQAKNVLQSKSPVKLRPAYAKKYRYRTNREFGFVYNNFNMDNPEFGYSKDPKRQERNKGLRCAIRKAFNWKQRVSRFYHGLGEAYPGVIPPGVDGYDPKLSRESVAYDPKGAKALLKKHGWNRKNLPVLVYPGVSGVRQKQFFEQFRGFLTKIGYPKSKIKFKPYATFGDFSKAVKLRKTDMVPMGWGMDYPDAENTLGLYYGPNQSPGSNSSNYVNPEFDKLFETAAKMQPSKERTEIYYKLNKMIIDDCVTTAGFSRTFVYLWHKDVVIWPQRDVLGNILKYIDVPEKKAE